MPRSGSPSFCYSATVSPEQHRTGGKPRDRCEGEAQLDLRPLTAPCGRSAHCSPQFLGGRGGIRGAVNGTPGNGNLRASLAHPANRV